MAYASKAFEKYLQDRMNEMTIAHEEARKDALNSDIDLRLLLAYHVDYVWGCTCPARGNWGMRHADQCAVWPIFASMTRDFGSPGSITEPFILNWSMGPDFFLVWDEIKKGLGYEDN